MKKPKNFGRFYVIMKSIRTPDKEQFKREMVYKFTNGRTSSMRDMSISEFNEMCNSLDPSTTKLKPMRSAVLKRIQRLGVDTTEWSAVDEFCMQPQICGRKFSQLGYDDLVKLQTKLIAISRKHRRKSTRTQEEVLSKDDYLILNVFRPQITS